MLKERFAGDFQTRVIELDGWLALGAHLPPKEKRGLVLIDPPFEEDGEFDRLVDGLAKAHRRWPGGIYALWYPLKDRAAVNRLPRRSCGDRHREDPRHPVRGPAASPEPRLDGTGMIVVNPPYPLEAELRMLLARAENGPGGKPASEMGRWNGSPARPWHRTNKIGIDQICPSNR